MSEENKSDEVENGLGSGEQQSECCCSSDSSCCCGDTSEESGCCDPDASQDDPNTGKKKTVKIEYFYLDQTVCDCCQGTDTRVEKAIEELAPIMDMAGYKLKMKRVEIFTEKLAKKHKFLSSPTVRVNGVDICPTCHRERLRLLPHPEHLRRELPSVRVQRQVLRSATNRPRRQAHARDRLRAREAGQRRLQAPEESSRASSMARRTRRPPRPRPGTAMKMRAAPAAAAARTAARTTFSVK